MVLDLSYLAEQPSDAQEQAIVEAVQQACYSAIISYLESLADSMEDNKIETLNVPTIRVMAAELQTKTAQ
jgi:hypothetical protein